MSVSEFGSSGWEMVIGLEVHCELATATKLFCGCPNQFGAEPNTNVCPVCLGLPGSLPVLNRQAVELAMRIGTALGCEVRPSIFHRKNYFYPDMPKDYQISQYDEPINIDGRLELPVGKRVRIERAHMEEDTGKTTHIGGDGRISGATHSLVDYNRAGVPLVEIVSAPDMRSAAEARSYVSELRAILVASGASDGKMEEGSLRVDANVSVRRVGTDEYGTRCEIKNMNSLRSLGRAIEYEAARQTGVLEAGEAVVQQTRHWDEANGLTSAMRSKEEAYDYRYFPEPDLVPVVPDDEWLTRIRDALGIMPAERRTRLARAAGYEAGSGGSDEKVQSQLSTIVERELDDLVLGAIQAGADAKVAFNRAANELAAQAGEASRLSPDQFARLVSMESAGTLSATQAKDVLATMLKSGGAPEEIATAKGYESLTTESLAASVEAVITAHPAEWERFVAGEAQVTGFLVGQVMKATGGRANGKAVTDVLRSRARA